jgi:hypothetical protein
MQSTSLHLSFERGCLKTELESFGGVKEQNNLNICLAVSSKAKLGPNLKFELLPLSIPPWQFE